MSGPKVVRIVTREEVVELCRGLLAQLDDAVEAWEHVGRRNGTVTDDEVRAVHRRREEIQRMLAADRLVDLQKAAATQVDFLWNDQQERLATAAARAAEKASAERRGTAVARAVLERLGDTAIATDLRARLENAAAGRVQDGEAVTRVLSLLAADAQQDGVTEHQRGLAARLREPGGRESLAEWMAAQVPQPAADVERLSARIAGLGALADGEAAPLLARLHAADDVQGPRRALLLDSLEADVRAAYHAARRRHQLRGRLRRLAAELAASAVPELTRLAATVRERLEGNEDALQALEAGARRVLDRHRDEAAAAARREAVLTGLAALGYQVSEGMQTAWVQDGRVVLRHGTRPGYGVELASPADADRLQVRAVAFRSADSPADLVRDSDAETLWCGDLHALGAQLAAAGGGIEIERALPVGAVPLRVVPDLAADSATQLSREPLRQRQIE